MVDELNEYLQGSYRDETRAIDRLTATCSELLDVLDRFFIEAEAVWPYEVMDQGDSIAPERFSFSTNAMIAFALGVATGLVSSSTLVPAVRQTPAVVTISKQANGLEKRVREALVAFPAQVRRLKASRLKHDVNQKSLWTTTQKERSGSRSVEVATTSASFGPNDPLTITWLLELLGESETRLLGKDYGLRQELLSVAREVVTTTFRRPDLSPLRLKDRERVPHSFPLLRVLQLSQTAALQGDEWKPEPGSDSLHEYLLNRVHLHISSSTIQEGGFDAGELVFSLEGVLLCSPESPDYALFDRAFQVLENRQQETPYWRPLRPFRVTSQGMVLLPQSVEIANSLLRICSKLDHGVDRSFFSDHIGLFNSYTRWLEARKFRGAANAPNHVFSGWQSENTFAGGRIHLWETSQVLLYLMHYAAMLQGHVARSSLRASRLSISPPPPKARRPSWDEWQAGEPIRSLPNGGPYAVYQLIGERMIQPRTLEVKAGEDWSTSAILYGPPGTGKSRVAEEAARVLGYRFVTVTPSDFITSGQEGVEVRAKNIFTTLKEQSDCVILFDEIDQLLLDRGSERYHSQGDLFKLITPGMLTKLNGLTAQKEVVFFIATNYFERIDAAVRRTGRISERLLVLPPDAGQRSRYLGSSVEGDPIIPAWDSLDAEVKAEVVRKTALYSYGELRHATKGLDAGLGVDVAGQKLLARLNEFSPTISIASYKDRVLAKDERPHRTDERGPLEEFVMVVYIAAESEQVKPSDREWIGVPLATAHGTEAVGVEQVWETIREAGLFDPKAGS